MIDKDIDIAEKTVTKSIEYMIELASSYMYENAYEKDKREVFMAVRRYGSYGMKRADILKMFKKFSGKAINSIISDLMEDGSIDVESTPPESGRGRPSVTYVATI
jgi:hypothetical protein